MNDVSSRSHAIFQILCKQIDHKEIDGEMMKLERVSKLCLVDLAGSERSGQINKDRTNLKEGNVINKSLLCLGKVISMLAERGKAKGKTAHIPYRESQLTWLLKESLGGNSKTIMLAAISPALINYEETLSTLRYANQAKNIVNHAVVNEDATATMVRQLNDEIEALRAQLAAARVNVAEAGAGVLRTAANSDNESELAMQLEETEQLVEELTRTWEEKLTRTLHMQANRLYELQRHGIVMAEGEDEEGSTPVGVMAPRKIPYLINLSSAQYQDQQCLVYYLKEGVTIVGRRDESELSTLAKLGRGIYLSSDDVQPEHCAFHCAIDESTGVTVVYLVPQEGAAVTVNGHALTDLYRLRSGDNILIASVNLFRFDNPEEARLESPACSSMAAASAVNSNSAAGRSASSFSEGGATSDPGDATSQRRLPPIGATDEDTAAKSIAAREEARAEAFFPYKPFDEEPLLHALITNLDAKELDFKLLPAYGLYLMVRHCQRTFAADVLNSLLLKMATLMKMALASAQASQDLGCQAFWLANATELVMVIRSDDTLATAHSAEAQLLITEGIQEVFAAIASEIKLRVAPALPTVLYEGGTLGSPKRQSSDPVVDVQFIISSLDAAHGVLASCLTSELIVQQLFSSIYFFMGAKIFNHFISGDKDAMFQWARGMVMRFNITRLVDWANQHKIQGAEAHLSFISQAALLLQINKSSLAHLDSICETCNMLNSEQLDHIMRNYRFSPDEDKIPVTLIDCVRARAMNNADVVAKEDESVGCKVQLLRNADFVLPFRLSGNFHMNSGLVRKKHKIRGLLGKFVCVCLFVV